MYFYIDESGNTGNNLFDDTQPYLFYGLISSPRNLDVLAEPILSKLRIHLEVSRLHANELHNNRLPQVVPSLISLQKAHDVRFNFYSILKHDHAIINFFDQVFDSGVNGAVPSFYYWTPFRYSLLLCIADLFRSLPLEVLKTAWDARISLNREISKTKLLQVCAAVREQAYLMDDLRAQEIIVGALIWAERNPESIYYSIIDADHGLHVSPNLIGFQQVMMGMANSTKAANRIAKSIIVDQQSQFNSAQSFLAESYKSLKNTALMNGPGLPEIDFSGMPDIPIKFLSSSASAGLEIVDIYLWATKRIKENKFLAPELIMLLKGQQYRGRSSEISIQALYERWIPWFNALPEGPTEENAARCQAILADAEESRLRALATL